MQDPPKTYPKERLRLSYALVHRNTLPILHFDTDQLHSQLHSQISSWFSQLGTILQISLLTKQVQNSQQAQAQELFVYDLQTGTISTCSFGDASGPTAPQQHFWDAEHPLLLACELAKAGTAHGACRGGSGEEGVLEVAMMFATPQGIVLQDCSALPACQVWTQLMRTEFVD